MIRYELSPINILQIQIFLSAAETLSFTKSAQIFNMTQSGISKAISKLEELLGFSLFIRVNRSLALTPAGEILYNQYCEIPNNLKQGFLKAKSVHSRPVKGITLGIPFSVNSSSVTKLYTDAWKAQYPQHTIHVLEESMQSLIPCITSNKFHFGIIPCAQEHLLDPHILSWRTIDYSHMQVIVDTSHPLASSQQLSLHDLAPFSHIIYEPTPDAYNDEYLKNILSPVGITPKIEGRVKSNYEIHDFLVDTQRILVVDGYFRYIAELDDCVAIPINDCQSSLLCVWKKEIVNTGIVSFLTLMDKLCAVPYSKILY